MNEFGDINGDSQILVAIDKHMLRLSNGYIYCSINGSLIDAVNQFIDQKDIGRCISAG